MKAFPDRYYTKYGEQIVHEGMDLRDYFAAKAMQALLPTKTSEITFYEVAEVAYICANSMMKVREQNEN